MDNKKISILTIKFNKYDYLMVTYKSIKVHHSTQNYRENIKEIGYINIILKICFIGNKFYK